MTDIVDIKRRSEMMARIRNRDTTPELAVRRIAHRMGLRFRLHRKDLPGRPDLVFPKHRLTVFVHGCFWHRHEGCRHASTPKSRIAFWTEKFAANVERDARQEAALRTLGWRVLVIWQRETRDEAAVERKLAELIGCDRATSERRNTLSARTVDYRSAPQGMEASIHLYSPPGLVERGSSAAATAALGFDERT
ncbi:MAG: DNA mismatch endonuclease Vsr [Gammaproteobacteria bacterium]|nr:DNA mismatch endonuclease Vsr [Gammaproteobacteria bacterium]